jgi:hypothetical protein
MFDHLRPSHHARRCRHGLPQTLSTCRLGHLLESVSCEPFDCATVTTKGGVEMMAMTERTAAEPTVAVTAGSVG